MAITGATALDNATGGLTAGATLDGTGVGLTIADGDLLQFVLPKGTVISSSSTITSSNVGDTFGTYTRLTSTLAAYNFPTIAVVVTA